MRWLWLSCALAACSTATVPSPVAADLPVPRAINGGELPARAADAPFRFLLAGHLYGDPSKEDMPAATLIGAVDELGDTDADLMVCLGDTFRVGVPACFEPTVAVLEELPFPVFNAVGNHDVTDRAAYAEWFGPTFGAFEHAGCLFIVLDTELETWEIAGEQLAFLRRALAEAAQRPELRAVFCCAHKLVFAHRQRYFDVLIGGNALDGFRAPNRFCADVLPLLRDTAKVLPVFWCGGDIGTARTLSAFVDRDPDSGVVFLATGIGDLPRDAVVEVTVTERAVRFDLRSLTGEPAGNLAAFDLAAWARHVFPDGVPDPLAAIRATLPP